MGILQTSTQKTTLARTRSIPPLHVGAEVFDPSRKHKVVFQPSGRSGFAAEGTSLLDAARQLGEEIESICGGRQTCSKCYVRIEEGEFPRQGLRSSAQHVTPRGERELYYLRLRGLPEDIRYSCDARILGDLLVTVPEESQGQKQVILKGAGERTIPVDPIIRLYYLELDPPRLDDRGDRERVLEELEVRFDLHGLDWDLHALQELPSALRQGEWAVTLTIWDSRLVVRVRPGYEEEALGLAVDVGSTTLAAYLCDLRTGRLLATAAAMNPQVAYGDDIMSRVSFATEQPNGQERLHQAVIQAINDLAAETASQSGTTAEAIVDMTLVGNSVMHHLALDLNPRWLGQMPFVPVSKAALDLRAADTGLKLNPAARLLALPLEAGYVGADNVGVLLAEQPHRQDEMVLLIDVGTNSEIVLGNRRRLVCTSSPTGPALEGAQIAHGMRAAPGAIERVRIDAESWQVRLKVIGQEGWSDEVPAGQVRARGICGSGIVEAIAEMYSAKVILPSGRFNPKLSSPHHIELEGRPAFVIVGEEQTSTGRPIVVTQADVRAIQLAKAALYVGVRLLMRELGIDAVDRIVLAGAFGSVIDKYYAMMIGMLPDCDLDRITSVGNAAGDGARIALLNKAKRQEAAEIARWVEHIAAPLEQDFQDLFIAALAFPHSSDAFPHLEAERARRASTKAAN
jgi:uncharacterized 2Fe-2S/4Fe-4S cluster protein (DUF4445 family)